MFFSQKYVTTRFSVLFFVCHKNKRHPRHPFATLRKDVLQIASSALSIRFRHHSSTSRFKENFYVCNTQSTFQYEGHYSNRSVRCNNNQQLEWVNFRCLPEEEVTEETKLGHTASYKRLGYLCALVNKPSGGRVGGSNT